MTLRPYQPASDQDAVIALWNDSMPDPYRMDARLWAQNTVGCQHYRPAGSFVFEQQGHVTGYIGCKVAHAPLGNLGLLPDRGWISVILVHPMARRQRVGHQLLQRGLQWLQGREVLLGGDPAHFFPGIPESAVAAQQFFTSAGFTVTDGRAWDLLQDLKTWQPPRDMEVVEAKAGVRIGPCRAEWLPHLSAFFERTFPGRWAHDVRRRLVMEPGPQDVLVARTADGSIEGFSSTWHPGSSMLGPSVYWRYGMGQNYGGLGPIGVSTEMRGKGLGLALVLRSIEYVKSHGTDTMGVDWTVLLDFYRKAGFEPWLSYRLCAPHRA